MKYRNYLHDLATAFRHRFEQISTHYNFDNGDEFEIALCYVLREILPQRYGICRGFVVPAEGQSAGDDIIIYDRDRFPALRLFPQESYDRKQNIPVEAVYAYIEAKNTLHLNDNPYDPQSIIKAASQVAAVKRIYREPRTPDAIHPYFQTNCSFLDRPDWPPILNPMFGAVFARQIRDDKGNLLSSHTSTETLLSRSYQLVKPPPDLIVAGDSNLLVPCVDTPHGFEIRSPFHIEGPTAMLSVMRSEKLAFATGICLLLYALDTIQLGRMPWEVTINDGFSR